LAEELMSAYEREARLAARLITRRAVSYALSNEQISRLNAALDDSSAALVSSKLRMEAISGSLEALQQDLERDVSMLCEQLEGVSEHRDALLNELAVRNTEAAEVMAERGNLAALFLEAEAERRELRIQLLEVRKRLNESDTCARLAVQERDQARLRTDDLTSQLKHAARFAAALEDTMAALPDLPPLAAANDAELLPHVNTWSTITATTEPAFPPSVTYNKHRDIAISADSGGSVSGDSDDADEKRIDYASFSSAGYQVMYTPLRTVISTAQQRAMELRHLKEENATLQLQVSTQAAAHAADAYALATAQREATELLADVAQLEDQLIGAVAARRRLEEDLAMAQTMLGELHDRLRASAKQLLAAKRAQADAESQLTASKAENAELGVQLQASNRELATARAHLLHAQHHVAEALAEKTTLRQHLQVARQQLQAVEAEASAQGERCRTAETAAAALTECLANVQADLAVLTTKLRIAQADAGSALAAKASLEAYVADLAYMQDQADAAALAANEELREEMKELQSRLDDAQAGLGLAERRAEDLQDQVQGLEARLAAAEGAAASADAEAQRAADLRGQLEVATAALQEAHAAVAVARETEASQAAALQAAATTITGLQATIGELQRSLAAAEQELQQDRAEAAAAAAASAAREARVLHDLHKRDATAAGLNASLAEARVQLRLLHEDANAKVKLANELAVCLRELQSTLDSVEAINTGASSLREARVGELAQQCEAACRAVVDLQAQLCASEAERRELQAQVATAESAQLRLMTEVTCAEDENGRLEGALHAAGETRKALEAQVAAGDASTSELQARLYRAEEVLSESLSQLADANTAVRLLHLHNAFGAAASTNTERTLSSSDKSSAEPVKAEHQERDGMRLLLEARLQQLQSCTDALESASDKEHSLRAVQVAELQRQCELGSQSVVALREQLTASENARWELMARAEEAQKEREGLLVEVAEALSEQARLREALEAAAAERRCLAEDLAANDSKRAELEVYLRNTQTAHSELIAQLAFSNSALQLLQQHLQNSDAERLDLQVQLVAFIDERRELRAQLSARLVELQSAMEVAEAASVDASAVLVARVEELQGRCEADGELLQQLRDQLLASEEARRELLERAFDVERRLQAAEAQVAVAESAQQALVLQAAETVEAAQQALHAALSCTEAERCDLRAQVADGLALRHGLQQRLENSEAARIEAMEQLADASVVLAALQQRLEDTLLERQALRAGLEASAEARRELQIRLSEVLLELQGRMEDVRIAIEDVDALQASSEVELTAHCKEGAHCTEQLQAQLREGEAVRQELLQQLAVAGAMQADVLARLVAATTERQDLEARAVAAEAGAHELSSQLAAALTEREEVQGRLAASAEAQEELRARLDNMEVVHAEAQAQLADAGLALRALQQNLDEADAERRELQAQLVTVEAEARGVQSQLAEKLLELQSAIRGVIDATNTADALQDAQRTVLEQGYEEGSRAAREWASDCAASQAAQQVLSERVAAAEARQAALEAELGAVELARAALETQVADAEAAQGNLQVQLSEVKAERSEVFIRLGDASNSLEALQRRLAASELEREQLQKVCAVATEACEGLQAQLVAATAVRERDLHQLSEVQAEREHLVGRVAAADAALKEMRELLDGAEAAHATEVHSLRSAARVAAADAAAQNAASVAKVSAAGEAMQSLKDQLKAAEASRGELQAQLAAADASRGELRSQLSASAAALTALQQQLEEWEAACDITQLQLARTDAIARDLMSQLENSETRRMELQQQLTAAAAERQQLATELADAGRAAAELTQRLTATEGAVAQLHNQLVECQQERDDLALQLADADAARRSLATQVYRFRTQMAAATDSAVIRRMTNATAIQEQYERLREEVAREREAGQARQERMLAEIGSLQAAADQSAVHATVRVALARACLRAAEDERRRLQEDMQSLLLLGARGRVARGRQQQQLGQIPAEIESDAPPSPTLIGCKHADDLEHCQDPITPTRSSSEAPMDATTTATTAIMVAAAAVSGHRQRTSIRVASLGGFLQQGFDAEKVEGGVASTNPDAQGTQATTSNGNGFQSNRPSATDYQQQLEHVRQRLIELRPQTARSLAAVDAALDVPSSFADMVQSAVNSTSPLTERWAQAGCPPQLRDSLGDSFSMVPDLSSLGTMLDANTAHSNAGVTGVAPSAGVPSRHEGAAQVIRFPPVVPFSTPVTEYRQSNMLYVSRNVTPSSTLLSPLEGGQLAPSRTIGEQLAALQDELNKVEETGRQLGARLEAASQSPPTSILETVTAQLSQRHQEAFLRRSAERQLGDACMVPALPVTVPVLGTSTGTGTGTEIEPPDLPSPDPLMQLDLDVATTPPDAHAVAASLAALRSGIQTFIAQQQQQAMALRSPSPHGRSLSPSPHQPSSSFHSAAAAVASLSVLLGHVQVLEDYLLGNSVLSALPTPIDMLLPLPRSTAPVAARYAAPVGAAAGGTRAVAGGSGTAAITAAGGCGVGRYTDGASTPLEAPSPKTELSSEAVTTPCDSPLLMPTESPGPRRLSASSGIKHHNFHHHSHNHHQQPRLDRLDQEPSDQDPRGYPHPHQYQYQHLHQTQKATRRQDLIAADGIVARPFSRSEAQSAVNAAAAADSDAVAQGDAKPSSWVQSSTGGTGRRVASIHALTYEDSSLSFFSPSLASLTRAQGLVPLPPPGKEGPSRFPSLVAASGIPPGAMAASGTSRMWRAATGATARGVGLDDDVGILSVSSGSTESHRGGEQYDDGYGQREWRSSESPLPASLDEEAIVLTATPVPRSPVLASEPSAPTFLPAPPQDYHEHIQRHQQFCSVSLSGAAAALAAAVATSEATARSRRGGICGGIGGGGRGSAALVEGSRMSSPSTPVSDDVCVATPLAFAVTPDVTAGAAAATPCITPAPLDAIAAEQLLRYTNPCFMRTPSASEICAVDTGLHSQNMQHPLRQLQINEDGLAYGNRHDYIYARPTSMSSAEQQAELPLPGPGILPLPAGADSLPALEISDSVDVTDLRAARRRMAGGGQGAVSIEEAPVASVVRVRRSAGRSMPVLVTPPPTVSSDEEETRTLMDGVNEQLIVGRRSIVTGAGPPLPQPDFAAAAVVPARNSRSISLQGCATENAGYDSYKADPHATGLLCLPTRSRRFSFRLSSRHSSRSSIVQPSNEVHSQSQSHIESQSQGRSHVSTAADDAASVASSGYQQYVPLYQHPYAPSHPPAAGSMCNTHRSSLEHSARGAGVPPLPPNVGGKEKKAGLLGKIKRAVGDVVRRSSSMRLNSAGSTGGASSSAGTQRGRSTLANNSINALLTPRPL
ncbi:hypothetical protein Vafri_5419, partial [Volvox africanus]